MLQPAWKDAFGSRHVTPSMPEGRGPYYRALRDKQKEQVDAYVDTLLLWSQRMNLTAVSDREQIYSRLVEDSLVRTHERSAEPSMRLTVDCTLQSLAALLDDLLPVEGVAMGSQPRSQMIDIGSGNGNPGLMLAIARPDLEVTLLDTVRKKTDFLRAAAEAAQLENVHVVWARAEVGYA